MIKLLALLLLTASAWAAPPTVVGNVNYKYAANPSTNVYVSRTSQATTNPCMCMAIWSEASATESVSGVVFAGVNFTKLTATSAVLDGANTKYGVAVWCATGLAAGILGNVSATVTAGDGLVGAVFEFEGVNQSSFVGNTGVKALSNAASPNAITITTSAADSLVLSFLGTNYVAWGMTPDSLYTLIYRNDDDAGRNNIGIYYKTYAAAGSTAGSTWTYAANRYTSQALGEILAATAATATVDVLSPRMDINMKPYVIPRKNK